MNYFSKTIISFLLVISITFSGLFSVSVFAAYNPEGIPLPPDYTDSNFGNDDLFLDDSSLFFNKYQFILDSPEGDFAIFSSNHINDRSSDFLAYSLNNDYVFSLTLDITVTCIYKSIVTSSDSQDFTFTSTLHNISAFTFDQEIAQNNHTGRSRFDYVYISSPINSFIDPSQALLFMQSGNSDFLSHEKSKAVKASVYVDYKVTSFTKESTLLCIAKHINSGILDLKDSLTGNISSGFDDFSFLYNSELFIRDYKDFDIFFHNSDKLNFYEYVASVFGRLDEHLSTIRNYSQYLYDLNSWMSLFYNYFNTINNHVTSLDVNVFDFFNRYFLYLDSLDNVLGAFDDDFSFLDNRLFSLFSLLSDSLHFDVNGRVYDVAELLFLINNNISSLADSIISPLSLSPILEEIKDAIYSLEFGDINIDTSGDLIFDDSRIVQKLNQILEDFDDSLNSYEDTSSGTVITFVTNGIDELVSGTIITNILDFDSGIVSSISFINNLVTNFYNSSGPLKPVIIMGLGFTVVSTVIRRESAA